MIKVLSQSPLVRLSNMQAEQQFRAEAVDRVLHPSQPDDTHVRFDKFRHDFAPTDTGNGKVQDSERVFGSIIIERDDEAKLGPWTLVEASRS